MAKRFGRNQKRKMQERIARMLASQAETLDYLGEAQRNVSELKRRLADWAQDVAQLAGRDSAFNERVRRMTVENAGAYGGILRLMPPVKLAPLMPSEEICYASAQTVIEALIWRLHLHADDFSRLVRIELESRCGEPVGYAVSPDMRWTEKDTNYLGHVIAKKLTSHLNGRLAA